MWKELEQEAGEGMLIWMNGLLNFGDPNYKSGPEGTLLGPIKNLERHGMSYRRLNADDIQTDYPFHDLPSDWVGLYAPDNGMIYKFKCF